MPASDLIRTLTCARQRLERGEACICECMGRGAGLGWTISVRCGADKIEWIEPATHPGEGVGYDRTFNCDKLREYFPDMLERLDRERANEIQAVNCYDWVNSFFTDTTGKPMDKAFPDGSWIPKYTHPLTIPPDTFQAGDIVIFKGPGKNPSGTHVGHVGIATGFGDEVSQLWYPRDIQQAMIERGDYEITDEEAARPGERFYTVTRDSLDALIQKFRDANGQDHVFSPFEVWRINDERRGNFSELMGCP
jgi:hypothetical protein